MHSVLDVIVIIGIVVYVIGRQVLGEPQRGKRLVLLPAVLTLVGALDLSKDGRHPQAIDFAFIAVSGLVAVGVGAAQGASMRLQSREGRLWGQMPVKSLWLWVALAISRVVMSLIAGACGAHVAASTASILVLLGINRLAQGAVIALRGIRAGIPLSDQQGGPTLGCGMGDGVQPSSTYPSTRTSAEPTPVGESRPATWQSAGQQIVGALGGALQGHRGQRLPSGRPVPKLSGVTADAALGRIFLAGAAHLARHRRSTDEAARETRPHARGLIGRWPGSRGARRSQ